MKARDVLTAYTKLDQVQTLHHWCRSPGTQVLHLKGLSGSSPALMAASCLAETGKNHLFILPDKDTAAYFRNDLINFSSPERVYFYPSSYKRSVQYARISKDNLVQRTEVLKAIQKEKGRKVIITFPEALVEKIVSRQYLDQNAFEVKKGDQISRSFLSDFLDSCGFELVDFVYEPGQYSIRGGIVDVFSFAAATPFRLDFFGEEVESLRSFDIENQLSIETLEKVSLIPDLFKLQMEENKAGNEMISLATYLGEDFVWWAHDLAWIRDRMDDIVERTRTDQEDDYINEVNKLETLVDGKAFVAGLSSMPVIE